MDVVTSAPFQMRSDQAAAATATKTAALIQ
jgi:hypothetical protein